VKLLNLISLFPHVGTKVNDSYDLSIDLRTTFLTYRTISLNIYHHLYSCLTVIVIGVVASVLWIVLGFRSSGFAISFRLWTS
jgi:hypothetical protein